MVKLSDINENIIVITDLAMKTKNELEHVSHLGLSLLKVEFFN